MALELEGIWGGTGRMQRIRRRPPLDEPLVHPRIPTGRHPGPNLGNRAFRTARQARDAARAAAQELNQQQGPGHRVVQNPRHAPGQLPHFHVVDPAGNRVSGHFFYGRLPYWAPAGRDLSPERRRKRRFQREFERPPILPRVAEEEADLFNAGEAGHERIESDALAALGVDRNILAQIYFGNWQRDFSQFLVPAFSGIFGRRAGFVCDLIFDVLDILAEAKFGQRLDRIRFGTYRWEEHIDNPREYGIALHSATCAPIPASQRRRVDEPDAHLDLWAEGRGALPNYLIVSQSYVLQQLGLAMRFGRTRLGLEHFGNAMHTVEDHYAHSNFIDIAVNHLTGSGDPMTGRIRGSSQPIRDSLGRYRLTTGIFLLSDTVVSLQKLLLHQIEGRAPGSPPTDIQKRIIRVLVERLLGHAVLETFDHIMNAWRATGIPEWARRIYNWTGLPDLEAALERMVYHPLRLAIANLLRPLADAAARQTGNNAYRTPIRGQIVDVIEMSHSRLAKDDTHHRYHGAARQLAIQAVRDFWREMENTWSRGLQPQGSNLEGTRFRELVDRYMNHPLAVGDWWFPVLGGRRPQPRPQPQPGGDRARPFVVLDRFGFDQAGVQPYHRPLIERTAQRIVSSWNTTRRMRTVRLVGHTDSAGPAPYNLDLGRRRAEQVRRALVSAIERLRPGLGGQIRFQVLSRGETQPAARGTTAEARARNRRVHIFLVGPATSGR